MAGENADRYGFGFYVQLAMRLGDTPYFVLAVVHSEAPVFLLKSC